MTLRLLVDAAEFRAALVEELPRARTRVFAQALTFEGDATGREVARLIRDAPAPDRRVIVDRFTLFRINDRFVHLPHNLSDRALWDELRATREMFRDLERAGAGVRFVNPLGFLGLKFPLRNHKKLVLVDDRVAYIGGINFSDHNFAWHDVMLRIEDPRIVELLAQDFLGTWQARNLGLSREFDGLALHVFDGRTNEARFGALFRLIAQARERIDVLGPYLSQPFTGRLLEARRRGVAVTIVLPEHHNWGACRDHVLWEAARGGLDVRVDPDRMTHLKSLVVDERALVLGSANLDLWSYYFQQEYMAIVTDPAVVADFCERVLRPDLARSAPLASPISALRGTWANLRMGWHRLFSLAVNRPFPAQPDEGASAP